jgi:prepilin-type N-terminal cleavage/methylation domain-containing protein
MVKLNKTEDEFAIDKPDWRSQAGRSLVETLIVVAIIAVLTAAAVPQMISARRLLRSAALPKEIATQCLCWTAGYASRHFQYDNSPRQSKSSNNNVNNVTAACNNGLGGALAAAGVLADDCNSAATAGAGACPLPKSRTEFPRV